MGWGPCSTERGSASLAHGFGGRRAARTARSVAIVTCVTLGRSRPGGKQRSPRCAQEMQGSDACRMTPSSCNSVLGSSEALLLFKVVPASIQTLRRAPVAFTQQRSMACNASPAALPPYCTHPLGQLVYEFIHSLLLGVA